MRKLLYLVFLSGLIACKDKPEVKKEDVTQRDEPFQLYQMSEMAAFMENMYVDHQRIKGEIMAGKKVDTLHYDLSKLFYARMTDSTDRDAEYESMAKLYVEYEEQLVGDSLQQKETFNKAINMCISCHQKKCTGPIPRIKKLLIR
ncbi:hypothetical protein RBU60_05805 [Mesonia sp. MT50]|uniref:Cytochrome c domain-containing protein n=1 Tax=Mesonia profundi TaxID=3070998 RepID=A0ABU1A0E9_9FLAO|nr:hypothetical protein [Mesonia profundi]MDQ7917084.1 hypothetical protein [Mesonia profundi]